MNSRQMWNLIRVVVAVSLVLQSVVSFSAIPASAKAAMPVEARSVEPFVSPVETPTPTPEVTATATVTPTVEAVLAATPTSVPTNSLVESETAITVDQTGGQLVSADNRIQLDVPVGVLDEAARLSITPRSFDQATSPAWMKLRFDLNAQNINTGAAISAFDQPLTLTLDLRSFPGFVPGQSWFVAYQDSDNPNQWHKVSAEWLDTTGVLQAQITHFSNWGAGSEPGRWHYQWQPPTVSTFSGAATFNYPIAVPAGRHGLTPNIDLSYSSRGVDGLVLSNGDQGPIGLGWSLSDIEISRNGVHLASDGAHIRLYHPDSFSLALNGSSYTLRPVNATTDNVVQYYADQAPQLFVQRIFAPTDSNTNPDRFYWIVKTGEGTTYRLGYTPDSETGQLMLPNAAVGPIVDGHKGADIDNYSGIRWRVDTVTDVYGNQIQYDYAVLSDIVDTYATSSGNETTSVTSARIISEIRYNYAALAANADTRLTGNYAARIVFDRNGDNRINHIYLYQWSMTSPYRTIDLGLGGTYYQECGHDTGTNTVEWIQDSNRDGTQKLPATTLTYISKEHGAPGANCFHYDYVEQVKNGYGGNAKFTYQSDSRRDTSGACQPTALDPTGCGFVPSFGQSYFVVKTETWDGIQALPAVTNYQYEAPCYDQLTGDLGYLPGASNCAIHDILDPNYYGHSPLIGFTRTTVTNSDYNGQSLSKSISEFYQDRDRLGRARRTQTVDPNAADQLLTQNDSIYSNISNGVVTLTYLSDQTNTQWDAVGNSNSTRTSTTYDAYGNLRAQYDYGAEEKVINAGFEDGLNNWIPFWAPNLPGSVNTVEHFAGQQSLQLQQATYDGGVYQDVAGLVPGVTYTVRVWVKATTGASAKFQIWTHDGLDNSTYGSTSPAITPGTDWSQVTWNYTANETGKIRIHLKLLHGTGTIYVDEVALARASDVGDERSTYSYYNNLSDNGRWFMGLKHGENIFKGITPNVADYTILKTQTKWYFDDYRYDLTKATDTAQISKGAVTMVAQGLWQIDNQPMPPIAATKYAYDAWGNPTTVTDPNGNQTTIDYDDVYSLYPKQVTNAKSQPTQYQYYGINEPDLGVGSGPIGSLKRVTDPNGAATLYTYDSLGRLHEVYRPNDPYYGENNAQNDPTVRYGYSDVGSPFWIKPLRIAENHKPLSGGPVVRHLYDGLGREIQTQGPVNVTVSDSPTPVDIVVSRGYDARGLVISQTAPYTVPPYTYNQNVNPYTTTNLAAAPKTLTQYDALGRPTVTTAPDNTTTHQYYGLDIATGLPLHVVQDANHRAHKQYVADGLGRLLLVRDVIGTYCPPDQMCGNEYRTLYGTTQYSYDVMNNLTRVTDALTNTTVMTYNVLGQKVEMLDPDMGHWAYQYDNAGNLVNQTDAKNQVLWFNYDTLNRLTEKRQTSSTGPWLATYTYDQGANGIGRRTGMSDLSGSTNWAYDLRGRMTQESKTINGAGIFATGFGYDALDRVIATTYPTGEVVTQTYNSLGALENVRSLNQAGSYNQWYASNLDYNANGALTLLQLGNNLNTSSTYDPLNFRLRTLQTTGLYNLLYAYDNVGNVTGVTSQFNTPPALTEDMQFTYDPLDRLERAIAVTNGYTGTYTYDQIGNVRTKNETGTPITYNYNAAQPHAVRSLTNGGAYDYDLNGNMTTRVEVSGATHITYTQKWDIENRLKSVMNTSTYSVTRYVYDGDGNRVLQLKPDGGQTAYIGGVYEVETSPAAPTLMYGFNGRVTRQEDTTARQGITLTLYCQEVCNSSGILNVAVSWLNPPTPPQDNPGAVVYVYDSNGTYLYQDSLWLSQMYPWNGAKNISLPPGSYQAIVKVWMKVAENTTLDRYSAPQSFAVSGGQTTSLTFQDFNLFSPSISPVTPLPYVPTTITTTALISATTNAAGLYALDPGSIPYTPGCNSSLRLVETLPPNNTAVSAQSATPGTVINASEIQYPALSSSDYPDNNFVVSGAPSTPSTPSDVLFADGFESGGFAAWSAAVTNGGYLSVIPNAALHGTQGLQAQIVNNTGMYVRDDTPNAETRYRARFAFDPNSISIGYSGMHDIFVGRSGTIDVFRVQVTRLYGSYQLRTQARFDSATYTTTAWLPVSDAAHLIEIDWQAATSSGANNGYLTLWIDGAQQSTLQSLDNDTRRVDEARLGPSNGIDTYTRGTEYFDDFESRRSTYIGPVVPSLVSSEVHKSYYRAGAQLIAMRVEGDPNAANNGLFFLHSDHLGSASLTTNASGTAIARQLYDAWGNIRIGASTGKMPTDIGYTGQRLDASTGGLMFYNARYYAPYLNRWLSPDTIVPDFSNPQSLNRYSYVQNNPLKYIDPSGHREIECDPGEPGCDANGRWLQTPPLPRSIKLAKTPSRIEQEGYTCSLAAATTVLVDAGVNTTFDTIANLADAPDPQAGGLADGARQWKKCADGGNPVCTSLQIVQKVAETYEDQGVEIVAGENWTIDMIRKRLFYDKRPVMVNYGGSVAGRVAHSIVIIGIDLDADNGANAKPGKIYYIDPLFEKESMALTTFMEQWYRSDVGDPLQFAGYHKWALVVLPTKKED